MDIYLFQAVSLSQIQKAVDVRVVALHSAIGHKAEHMKCGIIFFAVFHSRKEFRDLEKVAILNGFCDPCQFLINNAAGAHIEMSNLRVSHLSFRKSHCHSACLTLYKRALAHKLVHDRCLSLTHRIMVTVVVKAVAVKYH